MPVRLAGKGGAGMVGIVANRDDSLDAALEKLVHVLGRVCGNIDADVGHGADGEWVNITGGFGAGALDVEHVTRDRAQNALGHVAAAGVACAENKDSRLGLFFHCVFLFRLGYSEVTLGQADPSPSGHGEQGSKRWGE